MKLLTKALQTKLEKNYAEGNDEDIVVKFFDPCGAGTWLITQKEPNSHILWGLCDLGFGCVEYGTVSLIELSTVKTRFGLGIERDMHFKGGKLSDFINRESLVGC